MYILQHSRQQFWEEAHIKILVISLLCYSKEFPNSYNKQRERKKKQFSDIIPGSRATNKVEWQNTADERKEKVENAVVRENIRTDYFPVK